MCHTDCAKPEPMTHDRWLQIVEQSGMPKPEPRIRRQFARYRTYAAITLILKSAHGNEKTPRRLTCSILDTTAAGLSLISHEKISPRTHVNLEWHEGDALLSLSGSVVHCTGSVNSFKVGIELEFPPGQDCLPEQTTMSG